MAEITLTQEILTKINDCEERGINIKKIAKRIVLFVINIVAVLLFLFVIFITVAVSFSIANYLFSGFLEDYVIDTEFYNFITNINYTKILTDWFFFSLLLFLLFYPFTAVLSLLDDYLLLIRFKWFNKMMQSILKYKNLYEVFFIKVWLYVPIILTILLNIPSDNLDYLTLLFSAIFALNSLKKNISLKIKNYVDSKLQT